MEYNLDEFEDTRKKINKVSTISILIAILVLIIGVAVFFLCENPILLIVSFFAIFVVIVVNNSKKKTFSHNIKLKIITSLVKTELGDDAEYDCQGGIDLGKILKTRVYQHPDRYHLEDYIRASYNGVKYEMCDAIFKERHETRDSKGNKRVSYITYFSGKVIIIDFKKDLDFLMKIIEGHPNGLQKGNLEKIETEVIDFNKKFNTYVSDKEKAFYFLTPLFIQKILELEKLYKGTIQYVLDRDCFYIYINNSTDSLEFTTSKKIDEKSIEIIRSQVTIGNAIINEFNFDSSKFNG